MDVSITIPAQTVTIPEETVTVAIPVAGIVYQNSWLNQNSDIPMTNIFTPTAEGLFRVTAGIFALGTGNGGATGYLSYPGVGTSQCYSPFNNGSIPEQQNVPVSFTISANSGIPLQLNTGVNVDYDLFVTIEQLQ